MAMVETTRPARVLAVVTAAGAALAAGELLAGLVQAWPSPVVAVAEAVIDRAPPSFTRFGIDTFGTNDKPALIIGILVLLAGLAVASGLLARRSAAVVPGAFALLGAIGVAASASGGGSPSDGIPSVAAAVVGVASATVLLRLAAAPASAVRAPSAPAAVAGRLAFLVAGASFVALSAAAAAGGRRLAGRFSAAASRAALVLPRAARPLPAAPAGATLDVAGLSPLFTPNDRFYRIDTALIVPQVPAESWTLRVEGMVEDPYEIDFDELTAMGLVEADITLTCVSNPVGGDLVGNARWLGVPLRELLDRAGVGPGADQIVGWSEDGYSCGFPVEAAYDREALVAVGMNGEPLPLAHGFPARLVVPGLYGYVSATKWLRRIELTTFDRFDQYWVPRGYAPKAPIKMSSRIDVPRAGEPLRPGPQVIAGVAWAQTVGIRAVEVSIDDGPFAEAELAEPLGADAWRQWRFPWDATPGSHDIVVRAIDADGQVQTDERAPVAPNGSSGWQSRLVVVRES